MLRDNKQYKPLIGEPLHSISKRYTAIAMTTQTDHADSQDADEIRSLYEAMLERWNERDAAGFAALFEADANVTGFDGSQMNGPEEIEAELARIFRDHQTAAYVSRVRDVRFLAPEVAMLRSVAGLVPPGGSDIMPPANAIQSLVARRVDAQWRIALFQNTPAAFHDRPDLSEQLSEELRQMLKSRSA
jgi:uncharacterized protein (TIGR02246 family)